MEASKTSASQMEGNVCAVDTTAVLTSVKNYIAPLWSECKSASPLKSLLFRCLPPYPGSVGIQLVRKLKIGGRAFLGWNQGPVTWYNELFALAMMDKVFLASVQKTSRSDHCHILLQVYKLYASMWIYLSLHLTTEVMNNWEWLMCFQTSFGLSNFSLVK